MRPGDTVAVVAPSGPPSAVLLKRGVQRLESLGLKVVVGEHVLDRQGLDYLAGEDAARAADLQSPGAIRPSPGCSAAGAGTAPGGCSACSTGA